MPQSNIPPPRAERREPDMKFTFQENNRSEGLQQGFGGKVRPNRRTVPGNTAKSHLEGMSSGKVFFGFGPRPKRWRDESCRRIPARLESASGLFWAGALAKSLQAQPIVRRANGSSFKIYLERKGSSGIV